MSRHLTPVQINRSETTMGFAIELRRGAFTARTKRPAGQLPKPGMVEQYIEDGELLAAVRRLGSHRLPTLAKLDPYGNHTLRGEAVDSLVREIEQIDLTALGTAERKVFDILLGWGRRCRQDRDLRIGFVGD
jgi:hypothetical protein